MNALILAAGLSSRFGESKLLAPVWGEHMICSIIKTVAQLEFDQITVVYSLEEVRQAIEMTEGIKGRCRLIYNPKPQEGLSGSIRLGLSHTHAEGTMFLMGDQPLIDYDTLDALMKAFSQHPDRIIVPLYDGNRGNPVIFGWEWTKELKALTGDLGGRVLMKAHPEKVLEIPIVNSSIGKDIDTKDDYRSIFFERK